MEHAKNVRQCILNCPRIRGTTLHSFPKDEVRRQVWLNLLNMEYPSRAHYFLCGRHFSPRMISKKNLKYDAVPDINLEYVGNSEMFIEDASINFDDDSSRTANMDIAQSITSPSPIQSSSSWQNQKLKIVSLKKTSNDSLLEYTTTKPSCRAPLAPLEMKIATRIWKSADQYSDSLTKLPTLKTRNLPVAKNSELNQTTIKHSTVSQAFTTIANATTTMEREKKKLAISPAGPVRVKNIHEIDSSWKEKIKKVAEETKNAKSMLIETQHVEDESFLIDDTLIIQDEQSFTVINNKDTSSEYNNFMPHNENVHRTKTEIHDVSEIPLLCDEVITIDDNDESIQDPNKNNEKSSKKQSAASRLSSSVLMMGVEDFKKITFDIVDTDHTTYISQGTQTGALTKNVCAMVQKCFYNGNFTLNCFFCSKEFRLCDWQNFTNHVTSEHQQQLRIKNSNISNEIVTRVPKRQPLRSYPHYSSAELDRLLPNSNIKYVLVQGAVPNTVALMPLQHILDGKTISEQIAAKAVQNTQDSDEDSLSRDDDFSNHRNIINLRKTESSRVMHFLEVLRQHPLLFHTRRHGPSVYDQETEKFIQKFDTTMAPINFRTSMDHIRRWYKRYAQSTIAIPTTTTTTTDNPQLKEYFEILAEIEELSQNFGFYCDQCTFYFLDIDRLATHKYLKHNIGDLKYVCSCGLRFESEKRKDDHEISHKPKLSKLMCELCGMTFNTKYTLESHMNTKHADMMKNPLPYKCQKCDEKFPNKHMQSWHQLKHAPPRFSCMICGRTFFKYFTYNQHMKKHRGQRDHICEDCGKGFLEKRALKNHRYRMHDIGGHRCEYCNTYYANFENLNAHNQTIHPNGTNTERYTNKFKSMLLRKRSCCNLKPRTFKCKECGTIFDRQYQLMRHKRLLGHNLNERLYKCTYCTSVFTSRVALVRHTRNKHEQQNSIKEKSYILTSTFDNSNNNADSNYMEANDMQNYMKTEEVVHDYVEYPEVKNECDYAVQTIICSEEDNIIVQDEEIQEIFEEYQEELEIDQAHEISNDHVR